ncbi:hypothetical protein [Streptomyces halstedii]|uniref:hypothetical protein n=1 Tax=Streptomyces halstedii TaxID=1944 RepID=UPI0006895A63
MFGMLCQVTDDGGCGVLAAGCAQFEVLGSGGQAFRQDRCGLGVPRLAHGLLLDRRTAGEVRAFERVVAHGSCQLRGGDRSGGGDAAERIQGKSAAGHGGVLTAVQDGQPDQGPAHEAVDGEDLRADLPQQVTARLGGELSDLGVQGGEVGSELAEKVDLERQVDVAQGDDELR